MDALGGGGAGGGFGGYTPDGGSCEEVGGGDEVVGVPLGVGGWLAWMMEVEGRS